MDRDELYHFYTDSDDSVLPKDNDSVSAYSEDLEISDIVKNLLEATADEDVPEWGLINDMVYNKYTDEDDIAYDKYIDDPESTDDGVRFDSEDDTYQDSGEYRSYDGNREYRAFDADMPEASPEEWYRYAPPDQELEQPDHTELTYIRPVNRRSISRRKKEPTHPFLYAMAHTLLVIFSLLSLLYLICIYSDIPLISELRTQYIQTAMNTLNHKWMATAIIPSDIIDQVMRQQYESEESALGVISDWGEVDVEELPSFRDNVSATTESAAESSTATVSESTAGTQDDIDDDEAIFYEIFWEIDRDSFSAYLDEHPETLANGWAGININEAGLDDDGTEIVTIYGDQVLAINAVDGVMLARIYLSSNNSRGVLAICKDTSRLSLCVASTLGTIGQVAGKIAKANNGILAITGSAFDDPNGTGNGGEISGLAVCSGVTYGTRLGGTAKRLELRDDNKMYIVDSTSALGSGTRDAAEFQPALIVDGVLMDTAGWTGPNPRTALGLTSRLETIRVGRGGRLAASLGGSVSYVAKKMLEYGCVQAINLDGGTSAIMYYDGEYVTRCSNSLLPSGRTLPTAWVYQYAS